MDNSNVHMIYVLLDGIGMLSRVLEKLGTSPSVYHSIDLDRIRNKAVEMQQANNLTTFEI